MSAIGAHHRRKRHPRGISVTLSSSSNTLNNWSSNGSEVTGFASSATSVCNITLPIAASIGGVSATTSSTSVVVTDPTFLTGGDFQYTTTDFSQLKYFATITPQQIIQEVQKVGSLYSARLLKCVALRRECPAD